MRYVYDIALLTRAK